MNLLAGGERLERFTFFLFWGVGSVHGIYIGREETPVYILSFSRWMIRS